MARKKAVKKEVVVEKMSAIKKAINAAKAGLESNGIEGVLGLIAGL